MAKKIGNLAVVLTADHSALERGLRIAGSRVAAFGIKIQSVSSFAGAKFAALGGAVAAALSVHALREVAEEIDAIGKASARLGIAVGPLMGLQRGFKLAGVDVEAFNQATQTMTKNVEMGAMGLGKSRKAIADLGLDVGKLAKLTPENQLKVIAEAIGRMEDKSRAAADAAMIFGASGAALVPIFASGAAGLEEMQRTTEELGLSLSEVDVKQVEAANDALSDVADVLKIIVARIAIELSPYVTAASEEFLAWSKQGASWREVVGGAIEWVASAIAKLADLLDYGKVAWEAIKIAGAGAMWLILKPTAMMVSTLVKLVELAGDFLPQSMVDAAGQIGAFAEGLVSGIEDGIAESAGKISEIWTGPSMSDKVDEFFEKIKAKGIATAEEMAKAAPAIIKFTPQMFEDAKAFPTEPQRAAATAKLEQVGFAANNIIRAGSAEAQSSGLRAYTSLLDRKLKEQIELARAQLKEQAKIAKNTTPDPAAEDDAEIVFDG